MAAPWRESPSGFDLFPGDGAGGLVGPREYAVGLGDSAPAAGRQNRSGPDRGVYVHTVVRVRFLVSVRMDNQAVDYDAALGFEKQLLDAVLAINDTPNNGIAVEFTAVDTRRLAAHAATGRAVFVGELRFRAHHVYPLG